MIARYPYNTTMITPRFYCPLPLSVDLRIDLPENAARHACRVLRLRVGDELLLFDGSGGEYSARIAELARERVAVDVLQWRDVECEAPINITLVQALQSGEKMDMTVQKAVELGVARIVPVSSRRSVVRLDGERALRRLEHWRAVVASACEQCGRNRVPEVTPLAGLDRWLGQPAGDGVLRLMLAPGAAHALNTLVPPAPGGALELLIGAEGGLAPDEVEMAMHAGYLPVRLGPRILRTETAGLAALAAIQCLWGDFKKGVDHV
jgi:16S rRNA (uracil1498-N3)-methyltransferase